MATPTISGIVASNDDAGLLQAVVTFSVPVTAADLTGITISTGSISSVSSVDSTLVFVITGQKNGDTLTMSFATGNTITADTGGESLAEALLESVTNNISLPAISSLVASTAASGSLQAIATFPVAVTATDLTGITISSGLIDSVSSVGLTLVFVIRNQTSADTLTMSFATGHNITADVGGETMVETLLESVTNNISTPASTTAISDAALQTSAAIHTATAVTAKATKVACKEAC